MSGGGETVGRRYTKRRVAGGGGALQLDPSDHFNMKHARAEALAILKAAGYAERDLYESDGTCVAIWPLREKKSDSSMVEDSPEELAAYVLKACEDLELYVRLCAAESIAERWGSIAACAYEIGRRLAFAKIYRIEREQGRTGGRPQVVSDADVRTTWETVVRAAGGKTRGAISATANRLGIDRGQCRTRLHNLGLVSNRVSTRKSAP